MTPPTYVIASSQQAADRIAAAVPSAPMPWPVAIRRLELLHHSSWGYRMWRVS